MTSGKYRTVAISDITVNRASRQRQKLSDLESLAKSIATTGLINAPVVTPDLVLIAGERRLTACRDLLNWTDITVQIAQSEDEIEAHLIELEENVKRSSLHWLDRCHAVADYHNHRLVMEPSWTNENTSEIIGLAPSSVYYHRKISEAVHGGDETLASAAKYSVALGILERKTSRQADAEADRISEGLASLIPRAEDVVQGPTQNTTENTATTISELSVAQLLVRDDPQPTTTNDYNHPAPIINADFIEWQTTYTGSKFNFIHCDFPYGINHNEHAMGATNAHGAYADTEEIFFKLMDTLALCMGNVVSTSAHLMFWFSMRYYSEVKDRLEGMGWKVYENPLIWDKNNTGILADPARTPRHTYEVCFFASRGDRKIVRTVANIKQANKAAMIHPSEKAPEMLTHFFRMVVDESTYMLDPTSGSGNSIGVLSTFKGATCLGIELDPTFHEKSKGRYEAYWASERRHLWPKS